MSSTSRLSVVKAFARVGVIALLLLVILPVSTPRFEPREAEAACSGTAKTVWNSGTGANGHSYQVVCSSSGWSGARTAAENAGGYLATITSAQENVFLASLTSGVGPIWIGGYQPAGSSEPAGGWRWVTDEPFSFSSWNIVTSAEPNNCHSFSCSPEDSILFNDGGAGLWNDFPGSVGVAGYIVEFDDEADLSATLVADRSSIGVDEEVSLKLTATNNGPSSLTAITPPDELGISGTATFEKVSGPTPDFHALLESDESIDFIYLYKAKSEGEAVFSGGVTGLDGTTDVSSSTASSAEITVAATFKVLKLIGSDTDGIFVPGDEVGVQVRIEKLTDATVTGLTVIARDGSKVENAGAGQLQNPPSAPGTFNVDIFGRVADETDADVYQAVVVNNQPFELDGGVTVELRWLEDGSQHSLTYTGALEKQGGGNWDVVYPNYSSQTGDPPATANLPAGLSNQGAQAYYSTGVSDPLVRKWALAGSRESTPCQRLTSVNCTPDDAASAAEGLALFLARALPSKWSGLEQSAAQIAQTLEAGSQVGPLPCVAQSNALGDFARTLGLRAREINLALLYGYRFGATEDVDGFWYGQHSTNQIWYNGAWNYFDLFYANYNGGSPVRDFPGFYLNGGLTWDEPGYTSPLVATLLPFHEVKAYFAAADPKGRTDLAGDGAESSRGIPSCTGQAGCPWVQFALALRGNEFGPTTVITLHSPVRALYTDAQGRSLGAANSLTELDKWTDDLPPRVGFGGSVWGIPNGAYIAPETPSSFNDVDPNRTFLLPEIISLPNSEVTDEFTLRLVGTGNGPFQMDISTQDASGNPVLLLIERGNITLGQVLTYRFEVTKRDGTPRVELIAMSDSDDNRDNKPRPTLTPTPTATPTLTPAPTVTATPTAPGSNGAAVAAVSQGGRRIEAPAPPPVPAAALPSIRPPSTGDGGLWR